MLILLNDSARGVKEVKSHPFLNGVDWERVQEQSNDPVFVPETENSMDISYFNQQNVHKSDELRSFIDSFSDDDGYSPRKLSVYGL